MKKNLFWLFSSVLAASCVLFVACDDDDDTATDMEFVEEPAVVETPVLTVTPTTFSSAYEGGSRKFSYTITNPADDGVVTITTNVDWLTDIVDTEGSVAFTVAPNLIQETRVGIITVAYSYSGGVVSQDVTITQAYYEFDYPELTVTPAEITAAHDGGTYSFVYSTNTRGESELECAADADWIGDFEFAEDGTVSFTVDANTSSEKRVGEITVTFYYMVFTLVQTVTVSQE